MSISINSDRYSKFIFEVNSLLPTGTRVLITIYNDEAGTEVSNDLAGNPIVAKQFSSLAYQYPTETTGGFIKITFSDDSEFMLEDGDDSRWYFINETPFGIEQFV